MNPIQQFDTINLDLLKKYGKPGPRYTSYPTAPNFSPDFTDEDYREEILERNRQDPPPPISLYFHIPFCDTLCYFCGCNMMVTRDREKIAEYVRHLKQEMDMISRLIDDGRPVEQLHWGGGTPTHLNPDEIADLAQATRERFRFADDLEAGVEIDPRGMTREHLEALYDGGFNRISMGIQDFNEKVQEAVNRIQPEDMTREVIEWARDVGFTSLNIDLIYGLPFQSVETFDHTLDRIIDINPDRIAVFNYAHVPWMKKHQALIHEEDLPSPEEKLRIMKHTITRLNRAGYLYIGMDHFARPDNELARAQANGTLYRNFQGYSTKAGLELFGLGITSISQFPGMYAQNVKNLKDYYQRLSEGRLCTQVGIRLTDDDILRRDVIMQLMCNYSVNKRDVEREYDIVFDEYFSDALTNLEELRNDGCVEITADAVKVVGPGILVIRNVAMAFDAYLVDTQEHPLFSKTV